MPCLTEVNIGRPDTVTLSGSTTHKAVKVTYSWTLSGFDICSDHTISISSPVFSHPDSSNWCVELEKEEDTHKMCFHLVDSSDDCPVGATLKASILDQKGAKHTVYPSNFYILEAGKESIWKCITDILKSLELGDNWTFECEVCTVEIEMENTSGVSWEGLQAAVATDLECLLDSKDLTDITLITGGIQLKAHRAILCARSPVFRAMLRHDMKEAREGRVEIPDVETEVVSEMLRYMYTDRVQVRSDTMEKLLTAFDKYGLEDAKLKCEVELARQLTVDSAATIAACAIVHSCSQLQKVCMDFIVQNLEQVMGSKGWTDIIDKHPKAVKTISELVTEGYERCASPPTTSGSPSKSNATTVNSSVVESVSECCTAETCSGSSKTLLDLGYTCCERKGVIYVWTVSGLSNWSSERDFVTSPCFCHPEAIEWEVRLYKCKTAYEVRFHLLENEDVESVIVDLSVSVIPLVGEKCRICTSTDCLIEEGSESDEFECGCLADDVLTLECKISMLCVTQQRVRAIKPVVQSGLRQDLQSLLQSGNFTDFKLCAGTVELKAHRAILVARSPVFARMLQMDTEVLQKGQVEVPGVKSEVLAEVLHYMYTGRVKNLGDSTGELLAASHRFQLRGLERKCTTHLLRKLTADNAVATAVCAMENQCDKLLNLCVEFIRSRIKQVMATTGWLKAIDRHPTVVKRISQQLAEYET